MSLKEKFPIGYMHRLSDDSDDSETKDTETTPEDCPSPPRKNVKVLDGNFTERKYNQFFRMWMNGSAPKLEHLHVTTVNNEINENSLFRKLVCHDSTSEVSRKQPNKPGYLHQQLVTRPKDGGVCIARRDGTKAVVTVENNELEFFVFHPHCYRNDFDFIF
ncbi:hypothetical protein L3Y34_013561 [Caenorhabditis briggsae]|uniref:Sdz-33 F-box domain-containing protein n=1 Tax=Caenorhabditis briggsae TaxID=6238 RepID=A0AAE8ZX75_CAEBR|nr:hypothetical protein L3Y34_013561 [Caenorhabditis briggsae]